MLERLLPENVYVETIGLACRGGLPAASMPVGLLRREGRVLFRLFPGTRLLKAIRAGVDKLVFYSPRDPVDFYLSIEGELRGVDDCRPPPGSFTVLVECPGVRSRGKGSSGEEWFECVEPRVEAGLPAAYTRAYGCLVELLVIMTKVEAGVLGCDALTYARMLAWAVERSNPSGRAAATARLVLKRVEEALSARCNGVGGGAVPEGGGGPGLR